MALRLHVYLNFLLKFDAYCLKTGKTANLI
jgi:hypothetical protein